MSHFEWADVDVNAGNTVIGIISNIDYENLTADVEGVGTVIPIHYHCDEDAIVDTGRSFDVDYPDEQDKEGAFAFSEDDEVVVMYRRVNNEDPVIVGFADEAKVCAVYVVCNFDEKYYIVWNIPGRRYAVIPDPDIEGENIVFPCLAEKLTAWLEETNIEESEECYDWTYAGDKVAPTEFTTPYLSANTGCGDLYNTWSKVINIQQASDCDPDPIQGFHYQATETEFMPAYNYQDLIPVRSPHLRLWSFNLSGGLLLEDTHCFRSERTKTLFDEEYERCPQWDPEEHPSYIIDNEEVGVVFKTPIGDSENSIWYAFNSYYSEGTNNPLPGIPGTHTYSLTIPNSQDVDAIWGFYWKNKAIYSGSIFIQIYFTQIITYSRDGYWAGAGHDWVYSNETWERTNIIVAGANVNGLSFGMNPRNQEPDELFQDAIEDLLDYVVEQEEIPEHRVIEGEFSVEIRR